MMQIGALEAKNTFGTLLDRIQQGEEFVIIRDGSPVAKLIPTPSSGNSPADSAEARAASDRIRSRSAGLKQPAFDWETFKHDRDLDRP